MPSFSLEGVPEPSSAVVVIWDMLDLRGIVRASGLVGDGSACLGQVEA